MNDTELVITEAKFSIGDVVHHKLFDYRGVIVDVDPYFQLTEQWYKMVAKSRPPKDEPWYHVLVNDANSSTYVSEQNMETDSSKETINHPLINRFFKEFRNGRYIVSEKVF